jgi:hypothetical protein
LVSNQGTVLTEGKKPSPASREISDVSMDEKSKKRFFLNISLSLH